MIDTTHIEFKIADKSHLQLLMDMRVQFACELQKCDTIVQLNELKQKTGSYFKNHYMNNSYMGILGYYNHEAICCAGLLLYELPPLTGKINRTQGHLLNFYTIPHYRKMGVGTALLNFIMLKSKESGINRIFLNATKDGENIYHRAGFTEPDEKAMILYI